MTGVRVDQGAMTAGDRDDTVLGCSDMAMRQKGNAARGSR